MKIYNEKIHISRTYLLRSEGTAGAKVEIARAESNALESIASVLSRDNASQTGYMLSQRYMELFSSMIQFVPKKIVYLPYEVMYLKN